MDLIKLIYTPSTLITQEVSYEFTFALYKDQSTFLNMEWATQNLCRVFSDLQIHIKYQVQHFRLFFL